MPLHEHLRIAAIFADVSLYRVALRQAEEACRLDPVDRGFQLTLALAHYRLGQYQRALDVLARIQEGVQDYEHLAILAMANYRLGNAETGQNLLTRVRRQEQFTGWDGNEDQQVLVREAEALLQAGTGQAKN